MGCITTGMLSSICASEKNTFFPAVFLKLYLSLTIFSVVIYSLWDHIMAQDESVHQLAYLLDLTLPQTGNSPTG